MMLSVVETVLFDTIDSFMLLYRLYSLFLSELCQAVVCPYPFFINFFSLFGNLFLSNRLVTLHSCPYRKVCVICWI